MDEPLDLEPFKRRIEELRAQGAAHITSCKEQGHEDCPDIDCDTCDSIFGEAYALKTLVAEIERLRVEAPLTSSVSMKDFEQVCDERDELIDRLRQMRERFDG